MPTHNDESSSDFKRKSHENIEEDGHDGHEGDEKMNEKANEYVRGLLKERVAIDKKYPIVDRLLEQEIQKVQQTGKTPGRDSKYVNIYREKPTKVSTKVMFPIGEHPKFNFVGKLLGPKGNSLKRLQEDTMCKIVILGRGSMRDKVKEDELRATLDPKYAHLNDILHVEISAIGPPAEAHARMAYALAEVRKYMIPDVNDDIRQEQLREMMSKTSTGPRTSSSGQRTVMTPKTKILSILDRARTAMEESHGKPAPPPPHAHAHAGYEEEGHYEEAPYEAYSYAPPTRSKYEMEYEPEYRREYYREAPAYAVKSSSATPSSSRPSWRPSAPYASSRPQETVKGYPPRSEGRYRSAPYPRAK